MMSDADPATYDHSQLVVYDDRSWTARFYALSDQPPEDYPPLSAPVKYGICLLCKREGKANHIFHSTKPSVFSTFMRRHVSRSHPEQKVVQLGTYISVPLALGKGY